MENIIINMNDNGAIISYDEIDSHGKITPVTEEVSLLQFYAFLQNIAFRSTGILGKSISNNTTNIKLINGRIIKILNLKNEVIYKKIDERILKTIKSLLSKICKLNKKKIDILEKYNSIDLKQNGDTIEIVLSLDESGNLTDLSKEILDYFINEEFKNVNIINTSILFSVRKNDGKLAVYHNNCTITAVGRVADYIEPETKTYQDEFYDGGAVNGKHYNG